MTKVENAPFEKGILLLFLDIKFKKLLVLLWVTFSTRGQDLIQTPVLLECWKH